MPSYQEADVERGEKLARLKAFLNLPDAELLFDELEEECDPYRLLGKSPEETAYNVAKRDMFKLLCAIRDGEFDE